MKRLFKAMIFLLAFCVPLFCYFFLDQLYVRRFVDFSNNWFVRESQDLARGIAIAEIMKPYEEVVLVADDLLGFGVVKNIDILEWFGERGPDVYLAQLGEQGEVVAERIGFLKFRTSILLNRTDSTRVFFVFLDDMAIFNFTILMLAVIAILAIALLARARLARQKAATIQETTILAIQSMAHDFRAPFGKLRMFMAQLKETDESRFNKLKSMNDALDKAVEHADDVLTDFLSLEAKPELHSINCNRIIERLQTSYFSSWRSDYPHIELRFEVPSEAFVLANEQKLLRVLFNLIDNAIKHATSMVTVSITQDDQQVVFQVRNDGAKIEASKLKSIFKPFHTERKGGVGLGLFICDSFVLAQGGKLTCSSQTDDTRFKFALRIANRPPLEENVSVVERASAEYRIAYIDDEKFYLDALELALKNTPISVVRFKDTDGFLVTLKDGTARFDLVLVDRFGPNFDAVKDRFPESCRDYGYDGPIVLYSNSVSNTIELAGFSKALDKAQPLSSEKIIKIIQETKNEKV